MRERLATFLPGDAPIPVRFQVWTGGAFLVTALYTGLTQLDYNYQLGRVAGELPRLATERNTCVVRSFEPLSPQAGSLAFNLTVQLEPGTLPWTRNELFSNPSMGTSFSDGSESVKGLQILGQEGAPAARVYAGPNNGPDNPMNTAVVIFDTLPDSTAGYRVVRNNTVVAESELHPGLMRKTISATAPVSCGPLPTLPLPTAP